MITLKHAHFHWDRDTKMYTTEVSQLGLPPGRIPEDFKMVGPNGATFEYTLVGVDRDTSGEDVYGWHYTSPTPWVNPAKVLIIND